MNSSKIRDPRMWSKWRRSGSVETVQIELPRPAGSDRLPKMSEEDMRRCRRGLEQLKLDIYRLGGASALARLGLKEIVIWDPEDDSVCAQMRFEGQGDDAADWEERDRFPNDRGWVEVRRRNIVMLQWLLTRRGGIDEVIARTGARRFSLSFPPEVLEHEVDGHVLISNHLESGIHPNADYSVVPYGGIYYHS